MIKAGIHSLEVEHVSEEAARLLAAYIDGRAIDGGE